jgi:hypothetical protein
MTFAERKFRIGQEVVKKLTFKLNACKYTLAPYTTYAYFQSDENKSSSYTGVLLCASVTSDYVSTWSGSAVLYARSVGFGEIIKIEIDTVGQVSILERSLFNSGTFTISALGVFEILHEGFVDGSCYGYSQTCSSDDSYSADAIKEVVFCTSRLPSGSIYHAGLEFKSLNYQSAEIHPGESIGSRSRLNFTILDQSHNDYDLVPYEERRTTAGTMFGKLMARHPYFNGRKIIYSVGLRDAGTLDEPEWEDHHLIIDTINLSNGKFTGTALDPLILTEGKKAKIPTVSPAQLTVAVNSGSTNIQFGNAPADYFGTSGNVIVRIDSECFEVTANGTTTMPIVTNGFGNSQIKDHSVNATVQDCIRFVDQHVIDVIVYALENYTETPSECIGDYSATKALIPDKVISDYVLNAPMDVVDLINKCIFIGNLIFYFDDVSQQIVIKYISEIELSPIYINEADHIFKDSVDKDLNLKDQFTRFTLSWAPFDITKSTEEKNFQNVLTAVNLDMESPNAIGEVNERKGMLLPLLNSSSDDYLLGASAADRVISAAIEIPEIFTCELDAESIGETQDSVLELGSIVSIQSSENQNKQGIGEAKLYQVLKISGDPFAKYKVKFKRYQALGPEDYDYIIEAGTHINYVLTDNYDPASPGEYIVFVESGAIFGSYDTSVAAFDTGSPNTGVTFRFIARWQILGMGGNGADCGIFVTPDPGLDGGLAFEAQCDCIIDNGSGLIWAGGGGGGADATTGYTMGYFSPASGGGGGQGYGKSDGGEYTIGSMGAPPVVDGWEDDGSQSSAGLSGNFGGAWGENGANGESSNGGLAGIAIKSNGFNVTITSGNNDLSIRGRRT